MGCFPPPSGRTAGTLVAFRIEASDDAAAAAVSLFPADAPARECLIRWEDAMPFGTFAHYHMWSTVSHGAGPQSWAAAGQYLPELHAGLWNIPGHL